MCYCLIACVRSLLSFLIYDPQSNFHDKIISEQRKAVCNFQNWNLCINFTSFSYGYQQWSISFKRIEKALGVYLIWRNPSEGMKVTMVRCGVLYLDFITCSFTPFFKDFSITLLNRDDYQENQVFTSEKATFTKETICKKNLFTRLFYKKILLSLWKHYKINQVDIRKSSDGMNIL